MSWSNEIGRIGEQMVSDWLRAKGYIIPAMNFRSDFGEIDIIAENRDVVAFVEVKTRSADSLVAPGDAVDLDKEQKLIKTAEVFLHRAHLYIPYRFDVAEVTYRRNGEGKLCFSLNYVKNAFFADLAED